jgi:hypothetical protein
LELLRNINVMVTASKIEGTHKTPHGKRRYDGGNGGKRKFWWAEELVQPG